MYIPRYWVRATGQVPTALDRPYYEIVAWGWSNEDRAGAEQKAHERLAGVGLRQSQCERFQRKGGRQSRAGNLRRRCAAGADGWDA